MGRAPIPYVRRRQSHDRRIRDNLAIFRAVSIHLQELFDVRLANRTLPMVSERLAEADV
jgi:hypothetical protein